MKRALRVFLVASMVVVSGAGLAGLARADIDNATGTNVVEGDNRSSGRQGGASRSGDAVGGQVTGVVSSGRTSVDARNTSRDSDVSSGDADGGNTANTFTGLNSSPTTTVGAGAADINNVGADNLQEGDNRTTYSQAVTSTTGDGVAGQVIGAVTAAGGSASIVAANSSIDSSIQTGDADGVNDLAAFTGLNSNEFDLVVGAADIASSTAFNLQEGDNRTTSRQSVTSSTGDGVAGQVIGAVSAGATSIDATNRSDGVDVDTGDADGTNDAAVFTGQTNNDDGNTVIGAADITRSQGLNLQEGDNRTATNQSVSATSGDGVAGEVIGAVTSAGGSASIVAANTSTDSSVDTGDAEGANDFAAFTGLNEVQFDTIVGAGAADITDSCNGVVSGNCDNVQEGDNRASARQTANASTGDGVAGQVIGAVSAGATSIDATNRSDAIDVSTGDADADNDAALFVGLTTGEAVTVTASDIEDSCAADDCENVQEGDNGATVNQAAVATTGDAVGGEVIGAVTSAGGSASIVAANTSTNSDASTGDADATNDFAGFVGLAETDGLPLVVSADIVACGVAATCENVQEGDNRLTGSQTARASTGDGVAGQVLGVVSAGATSVDAANRTDDSSAETGDADAHNDAGEFVGLFSGAFVDVGGGVSTADISGVEATNIQEGDNRKTIGQTADASSGDAVAGQVTGVVTSAGGSASVVVANTSTGIDSSTGDSTFDNADAGFVGLNTSSGLFED